MENLCARPRPKPPIVNDEAAAPAVDGNCDKPDTAANVDEEAAKSNSLTASIRELRSNLMYIIDIDHGLFDELRTGSPALLTFEQYEILRSLAIVSRQVGQLLDYVAEMTIDQQQRFLEALLKTQQRHAANYLRHGGQQPLEGSEAADDWPLVVCEREMKIIDTNWATLIKSLDTRNGLLDEMFAVGCINDQQQQQVNKHEATDAQRNEQLLFIFRRKSIGDFKRFVECLVKTKQHQILAILTRGQFGEPPLCEEDKRRLTLKHAVLVRVVDLTGGLLDHMMASSCITWRQREFVEMAGCSSQSIIRLLAVLRRGSQPDFEKFLDCLTETNQEHVRRMLREDGVVAHIVAKTSGEKNLHQDETIIVERFMDLLKTCPAERRENLFDRFVKHLNELRIHDVEPVAAKTETSIGFFYLCKSFSGLQYLYGLYINGELKRMLQDIFLVLLNCQKTVQIDSLVWDTSNFIQCMHYACSRDGLPQLSEVYRMASASKLTASTFSPVLYTIEQFPFELIEMILFRAAALLFDSLNLSTSRAEVYTLVTLCSVSQLWMTALTRRPFKKRQMQRHFRRSRHPFVREPKRISSLSNLGAESDQSVSGVAEHRDILYATCSGSNAIQLFSSRYPFERLEGVIKIPGLDDPRDIVVCPDTGRLFVADWNTHCIWRLQLLPNAETDDIAVQLSTPQCRPWSISTRFRRLLVTPFEGVEVYLYGDNDSDDGGSLLLLRSIRLPEYMRARHAIETGRNTVIVGHRNGLLSSTPKTVHHDVSEVNFDGAVVRRFSQLLPRDVSLELNDAWHMALADDDHVIVADRYNERVVLLSRDLQLKRVLIAALQGQPRRLCYSRQTGLLFVAFWESATIDVFRVK